MAIFESTNPKEKEHKGLVKSFAVDVIKWEPENDDADIIAHKYEYEDFPNGSYLIVGPSQIAVFTNNITAGSVTDIGAGKTEITVILGPANIKLETGDSRFEPFRRISHTLTGGESAFHSTVYFINAAYMNDLKWGTQEPIPIVDPKEEVNVHVRALGMFGIHIEREDTAIAAVQVRKFLQKLVATRANYTREQLMQTMRARILEVVPALLAQSIQNEQISVLEIHAYLEKFSTIIHEKLINHFDDFGLTLDHFSFHSISVPDEDLRAINEMKIEKRRIRIEAEKMDIESAARARMREREGYTYQQEEAFRTMQAAASNEGAGSNFMGAGMGLGMGLGVGGIFGAEMGNIAQNVLGNVSMNTMSKGNREETIINNEQTEQIICMLCGTHNPSKAKFCIKCGGKIEVEDKCPNCGESIVKGAKFCLSCGTKLKKICSNCGTELGNNAKFCLECGTQITEDK